MDRLTVPNVLAYLSIAQIYELVSLQKAAQEFVHRHFLALVNDDSFHQLDVEAVAQYLQNDDIYAISEENVFGIIEKWINYDVENRKSHYLALLEMVRAARISSEVCYYVQFVGE